MNYNLMLINADNSRQMKFKRKNKPEKKENLEEMKAKIELFKAQQYEKMQIQSIQTNT